MIPSTTQQLAAMETLRASGWTFSGPAGQRLQLMTVSEVAQALGFERKKVERMAKAGSFPGARVFGSDVRIPAADVERLIAAAPLVFATESTLRVVA